MAATSLVFYIFLVIMLLSRTARSFVPSRFSCLYSSSSSSSSSNLEPFLPPYSPPKPFPYPNLIPVPGTNLTLKVVYTDYDSLVVVSKPTGLLSVPGSSTPTPPNVVSAVCREFNVQDVPRAVVHRLDMDTSGLLIVALKPEAQRWLYKEFREKRVKKVYNAIVVGTLPNSKTNPNENSGSVKSAKDLDSIIKKAPWQDVVDEQYLSSLQEKIDQLIDRKEIGSKYLKGVKERAEASAPGVTRWESEGVVQVNGVDCTRLKLYPQTGRTHQLRVFCRYHFNRAILGDQGYMSGGLATSLLNKTLTPEQAVIENSVNWKNRMCLHAGELSFRHHGVGQDIQIEDLEDFNIH
ncbi:hypothetical protein TrLO_g3135 [Triparma laevis f. longispina]|uniref:Pseudouridine synthase RsuA/RluA-like domain-containing protein n=1 Tax=Triparma laevis f. longispina TaxID=1714387 RepID=A0A9W7F4C1_9STRA|nr:hypothetical protein TrLO_g3135 [Triparma laevis f. longispina]